MEIFIRICFFSVFFCFFSCGDKNNDKILNPNFEKQLVATLDLNFVNSDTLYNSNHVNIFNDTIVGYKSFGFQRNEKGDVVDRNDENFYFIQSLKNLPKIKSNLIKIPISNKGNNMNSSMDIDTLKNGCLYFGQFGGSTMIKLCSDNTFKVYFEKYQDDMFYAMQIFLYKGKTIIRSMNAIYIYDTEKQKLLFKHKYYNDISESVTGQIVGDDFIFKESEEDWTEGDRPKQTVIDVVRAIDLNSLKYKWSQRQNPPILSGGYVIHNKKEIAFGRTLINLKNGTLNHTFTNLGIRSIENDGGYLCVPTSYNSKGIIKFDKKFNKKWQVDSVSYWNTYGNKIIGTQKKAGKGYTVIINRTTGQIEARVLWYSTNVIGMNFIDSYILFSGRNLYK